jgi:spore maturation protein CgeB
MRILFVHAAADMSIGDVSRGYRMALERQGHEILDYYMTKRIAYHESAIPKDLPLQSRKEIISRMASETIFNEAIYHNADFVLVVSGLSVHPVFLWLLRRLDIPTAVIFTESPYDDLAQAQWASLENVGERANITIFTNDEYSAEHHGWHFLPPSYDPNIHRPEEPNKETKCDVFMCGSGWVERTKFLEAVDWTGIHLKLYGIWPMIKDNYDSPLYESFVPLIINNQKIAGMYAAVKISLNFHRAHEQALTPNPRIFEAAACGVFQLSDPRKGLWNIFGESIPTFKTPAELEQQVRYFLERPEQRQLLAAEARRRVEVHTFDTRAVELIRVMEPVVAGRTLQVATV